MSDKEIEPRSNIIQAINAPLGFFVLCLLIVEVFLAAVLTGSSDQFQKDNLVIFIYLGVGMFALVVLIVSGIVYFEPKNIMLTESGHIQLTQQHIQLRQQVIKIEKKIKNSDILQTILREASFYRGQRDYRRAEVAYERARTLDPNCDEAHVGLAVVKNFENPEKCEEPLSILDEVIERNPEFSSAYYNRACIRCIDKSKDWGDAWLEDLQQAVKLSDAYKVYAKNDTDFERIRDNPIFKEITS